MGEHHRLHLWAVLTLQVFLVVQTLLHVYDLQFLIVVEHLEQLVVLLFVVLQLVFVFLFPSLTHPSFEYGVQNVPQYEQIMEEFRDIVYYNETWQVRLSTHPDQFNVLASENNLSVEKTIAELNHHGWVMDMLGCERSYYNPINIHVNW